MRRLRLIPWLLGVALILTTLAGANKLLHPTDPATTGGGAPPKPPVAPPIMEGLVAKGTVRSDPLTIAITLPSHLSAGTLEKIFVRSGDEVKANDPLVQFDDSQLRRQLESARDAHQSATASYNLVLTEQKNATLRLKEARQAVEAAMKKREDVRKGVDLATKQVNKELDSIRTGDGRELTEPEKQQRRADDLRIFQEQVKLNDVEELIKMRNNDVERAMNANDSMPDAIKKAYHATTSIQHDVERLMKAIADCTVRARVPGMIEQVTATASQTVYPQTTPLLYLVPAGPRVVWAEVVPDFAHKIKDRMNQKVTITDDSNTHLTYEGVVKRISNAFLAKPNGVPEILNGKPNVVLIVEIEVTDAAPAGQPPLRVGQPVRVIFPETR